MTDDKIAAMMKNHGANSWDDIVEDAAAYDDETKDPLTRVEAYVDHCFDAYDVVSEHLTRDRVQVCVADWGRRRGQARYNCQMDKRKFGKRVPDSKYRNFRMGHYSLFLAEALVGVPPKDDKGVGWKACVRHELGHLIDYGKHGSSSGHGARFKRIMDQFGHENNDGQYQHGLAPRAHRR